MSNHPSLNMPFVPPAALEPKQQMDSYDECWCHSGKKWKWCHKQREKQKPVSIYEHISTMRAEATKGFCSHPAASSENCSERIVRAHTVQRNGGLAAIAENGHVVSAKTGAEDIFKNDGIIVPREIGVRTASTFMGFCNRHDTEMFRPIETGTVVLNTETAFLLSFRALAYECFTKEFAIRTQGIHRKSDKGRPFEIQCMIQEAIYIYEQGLRLGLADLGRWKADYDTAYLEGRFDAYRFYGVAFSDALPIVGCGGFHPEYDFTGQPLQKLGRSTADFEHVTYNLTILDGRSIAVLGWIEGDTGPAAAFTRSFANLPMIDKAESAVRLAFEHLENIYFRPSWWHGLPEAFRASAIDRIRSGIGLPGTERQPNCLVPDGINYVPEVAVSETIEQ